MKHLTETLSAVFDLGVKTGKMLAPIKDADAAIRAVESSHAALQLSIEVERLKKEVHRLIEEKKLVEDFVNNLAEAYSEHRSDVTETISMAQNLNYKMSMLEITNLREHRYVKFATKGGAELEYDTYTTTADLYDDKGNLVQSGISGLYSND